MRAGRTLHKRQDPRMERPGLLSTYSRSWMGEKGVRLQEEEGWVGLETEAGRRPRSWVKRS